MLGRLYIKTAAVQRVGAYMPSMAGALRPTRSGGVDVRGSPLLNQGGPDDRQNLKDVMQMLVGRVDLTPGRIEHLKQLQRQPQRRMAIPADATHRDTFGNFYAAYDGQYYRIGADPYSGERAYYPVAPQMQAHGQMTTTGLPGTDTFSAEDALGLTPLPAVGADGQRAGGATHIDQTGQFFRGANEDMADMQVVNPEMAKNYTMNGLTPPKVDRSRASTADMWRAANPEAAANTDRAYHRGRANQPSQAYVDRLNTQYELHKVPMAERPQWLQDYRGPSPVVDRSTGYKPSLPPAGSSVANAWDVAGAKSDDKSLFPGIAAPVAAAVEQWKARGNPAPAAPAPAVSVPEVPPVVSAPAPVVTPAPAVDVGPKGGPTGKGFAPK